MTMTFGEFREATKHFDDEDEIIIGDIRTGTEKFMGVDCVEQGNMDYIEGKFCPADIFPDDACCVWVKDL